MRPLKLIMSAFGPYAGEETIDFEKMGNRGLYLITGDTGSGKTTVFDAVSFALFGESSGGNREPSMLRSRFAEAKTKTFVELTFLYKGREYRVRRNPEYLRPKDRGEGETSERADAVLYLPGDGIVEGVKNVNEKIAELLGVNKDQFSHIAMIAQGEFLKLLLADTKKRSEIFREIFGTKKYQALQDALKSRSGKLHEEYDEISRSIRQYLEGVLCPKEHIHFEEFEKMKSEKEFASNNRLREMLEELCEDLRGQTKELESDLKKTEKEIERNSHYLGIYKSVKQGEENLQKMEEKKEKLILRLSECRELLAKQEEGEPERKALSEEITIKKEKLKEFEELDELVKSHKEREKQLQESKKKIGKEEKAIEKLEAEKQSGQEQKALFGNPLEKYAKAEGERVRFERLLEVFEEYQRNCEQIDELQKEEAALQKKYKKAAEDWEKKLSYANNLERAFLDGQAGVLAAKLEQGKPCPVCGSTEHPQPALSHEEIPGQDEVEQAREEGEAGRKKAVSLSEQVKETAGRRKALEEKGKDGEDKLFRVWQENMDLPFEEKKAEKAIKERISKADGELKKAEAQKEKLQKLEERLPELEQELKEKGSLFQKLKEQAAKEEENVLSLRKQIEGMREKLGFSGKKEAEAHIKELEKNLTAMKKAYDAAKKETENAEKELSNTEASIKTLEKTIKKSRKEMGEADGETLLAGQERLAGEKARISAKKQETERMWNADDSVQKSVASQLDRLEETGAKWQMVKALHNTANGSIAGKDKIMLETYVQMAYFDRIIDRANVHLMKMTDGRYDLIRSKEAGNQKSQSGLELNVADHYYMSKDGGSRSVKSLSGGESFLAALSLALGMSEEVSANAGGIETDALFVDEGFGTLDESALDRAVSALQELSNANRIVGIISHVPELKNRIERQIVVKKTKGKGSGTELVV